MAYRTDYEKIGSVRRDSDGYLRGDAVVTRAGVFRYFNADGSPRYELRHPDDVFKQDSLDSLKMKPITKNHPKTPVDSKNARGVLVGMTGEKIEKVDNLVKANLTITDEDTIKAAEQGQAELSAGYKCDVVEESGVFEGQQYTHRQTNIVYNHAATCIRGRAGKIARLNIDSDDSDSMFRCDSDEDFEIEKNGNGSANNKTIYEGVNMAKLRIDSAEHEVPQEVFASYNALLGERDSLKSRCDAYDKRDISKEISEAVKARRVLETAAGTVLKDTSKFDSMSDDEIKIAVVKQALPDFKVDSEDAGYLEGCFATAVSMANSKQRNDAQSNNRSKSAQKQTKEDSLNTGSVGARERYIENLKNASKGGK